MENLNKPAYRYPTLDELEEARRAISEFGDTGLKALITCNIIEAKQNDEPGEDWPIVVLDFERLREARPNLPDILLVSTGTYRLPSGFCNDDRTIIGIVPQKCDYPRLFLEGRECRIRNSDTGEETILHSYDAGNSRFTHVLLDADKPTLLEIMPIDCSDSLTDSVVRAECATNVEAIIFNDTLCYGRYWAVEAYGPDAEVRGGRFLSKQFAKINARL